MHQHLEFARIRGLGVSPGYTRGPGLSPGGHYQHVILLLAAAWLLPIADVCAADRIVLRNLTIISDRTVASMTLDGVKLDDGKMIAWDEIEAGKLDAARQPLFDKYLQNVGIHLYRIRQRMSVGDFRSLGPHAEAIAKYYQTRDSDTGYLVMQALMWSRLAEGQREAAVAPYFRCYELLRARPAAATPLPGQRRLKFDPETGLCSDLPPVWFDAAAAQAALPTVIEAIGKLREPRPDGARIYLASLALAAGDGDAATKSLAGLGDAHLGLAQLKEIVLAQQELHAGQPGEKFRWLAANVERLEPGNRPLGLYWLGMSQVAAADRAVQQQGLLALLRVPAAFGSEQPDLAAASLFQAMKTLESQGDVRGSVAVRGELLGKFAQTWHASQASAPAAP